MSRVEPDGPKDSGLAIFGEMPGWDEQLQGRGFVGKSGKELWNGLARFCGLARRDFYVSNLVKWGLNKNRRPTDAEVAAAIPEFLDELEEVRPKVLITAGGSSTRAVLGGVSLATVHGIPHRACIAGREFTCFPIYHPAAGLHSKGILTAFAFDLQRLAVFLRGESEPWHESKRPLRGIWCDRAFQGFQGAKGLIVGLDTEGWVDKPHMVQFSIDGETGWCIRADDRLTLGWFRTWILDQIPVLHNGLHDLAVLRSCDIELPARWHDTQVLAYHDMLSTGSGVLEAESQNLGTLGYRELQIRLGEIGDVLGVDLESRHLPYSDAMLQYAGADPCACYRLFKVYESRGVTSNPAYTIDMRRIRLVREMMDVGLPIDMEMLTDYYCMVLEKLDTADTELKAMAAKRGNRNFNPGSPNQVRELVTGSYGLRIRKRTKGGKASTNEKALAGFKDHPFVAALQSRRELSKLSGTYIRPLIDLLQD